MKVSIIGLGNMGTAIGNNIAKNGYKVLGWEYFKEVVKEVNSSHKNSRFLPGIKLSPNLTATNNLKEALLGASIVFVALPSAFIRKVLNGAEKWLNQEVIIVNLSKGVEEETCYTASKILKEIFPKNEIVVLSGPSLANEFSKNLPCEVVLAGSNKETLYKIAKLIETETFRTVFSHDIVGVEWSGILKNIYAIGLGLIEGAGIRSFNFTGVFITKAVEEMANLVEALGGEKKSVYHLSGLGDLIATSLSEFSHNRRLGKLLSQGYSLDKAKKEMGNLPEGVKALKVVVYLAEKYSTPIPVAKEILQVIEGKLKPSLLVKNFMRAEI